MKGGPFLIGARSPREVVFVRNTTEAINLAAVSLCRAASGPLSLRAGDEVIPRFVPWQVLCREPGLRLRIIGLRAHGELASDELTAALGPRTRLVCVTHVSNVLGTINPVGARSPVWSTRQVRSSWLMRRSPCRACQRSGSRLRSPCVLGLQDARAFRNRRALRTRGDPRQMSPFLFGGDMIETVTGRFHVELPSVEV